MISELQKQIYNSYLRISRSKLNKPFKLREDFSNFQEDEKFVYIQKLEIFFKKYSHIRIDDFFSAPFEYYKENTHYSLDFFTTLKAINVYRLNEKRKLTSDPDEKNQLIFALETIKYIRQFTKDRNIPFEDYIVYRTESTPQFLLDIKNRTVSIYVLFCFEKFETVLSEFGPDLVKFVLSEDFYETLDTMRTKYYNSKTTKQIVKQQINKLTNKTNI
jgi:hypothetical protein